MGIITIPRDLKLPPTSICVVCGKERKINQMSAGLCDDKGQQAFACEDHLPTNTRDFIRGWIDFASKQTPLALQSSFGQHNNE